MKNFKYLIIGVVSLFVFTKNVQALDYYIKNYDVDIVVNKDNSFDITEEIEVYFNLDSHGIFRSIPLRNEVKRLDGSKTSNRAKISNIKVSENYSKSIEKGNCVLKIGDTNRTLTGRHTYIISYNYNIGKDRIKDKDEFYFNIIGPEWEDTRIDYTTFRIRMPLEFDKSKLGFSSGTIGISTNDVRYNVSGNIVTGSLSTPMYSGQALTVRLELPDGYFSEAKTIFNVYEIASVLLPIVLLILAYIIYSIKSKVRVIDPVEFYSPENLNSLETAFIYKGRANGNDVTSLLVYLASKGYLKIEENESKSIFQEKNIKLVKLKDYDGEKEEERIFLEKLFKSRNEVTLNQMKTSFYTAINQILNITNSKEAKKKIIKKGNTLNKTIIFIMAYLSFVGSSLLSMMENFTMPGFMIIPISLFYIPFIVAGVKMVQSSKVVALIWNGFIIFHGSIFYFALCVSNITTFYFLPVAIICTILIAIIGSKFVMRTDYGNELYGKILGFKKFLVRARKEELEREVNKNPSYFYDILPFAYVLGISNKWIKKFETLNLPPVDWYTSTSVITAHSMGVLMSSTARTLNHHVVSSSGGSSSGFSGGGSSSGGGFSGGGSGGGGGGRW